MYIIQRVSDGAYVKLDSYNHITYTKAKTQAYRNEFAQITNFLNNCVAPKERENHIVISCDEEKEVKTIPTIINPSPLDIDYVVDNVIRFTKEDFNTYETELHAQLVKVNDELLDIEHYIEFNSLDVFKGYRAYKMLHDCRIRRREIKDKIQRFEIFKTATWVELENGVVTDKINNFDTRSYNPRVLKELFEV